MSTSGEMSTALIAIIGIWSLVGLGFFIWYLAALARLFPKLGLPGWAGWVPLWNEWQLFWRAGLPGWLVLSYLIPGLGIIAVVVRIIAIHRLNTETRHGAGFTVLGAIIPPLWATLLGSELIAASPSHTNAPRNAQGQPQAQQPAANRSIDEDPWRGLPPVTQAPGVQPQYQQPLAQPAPPQQAPPQQAPVQQAPAQQYQPEQPQGQQPSPYQPPQQFQQPPPYQAPEQQSPPPRHVPPHPPVAAGGADSFADLGIGQPRQDPPEYSQPPQYQAPEPPAYSEPQSEQEREDEWGLGLTTEREFERLAAEKLQHPPAAPLAPQAAPQPFSWPGTAGERNSVQGQQQSPDQESELRPESESVPEAEQEPESSPEPNVAPTIFDSAPPAAPPIHHAAAPAPPSITSTGESSATGSGAAGVAAPGGEAADSDSVNQIDDYDDDELDDHTVVVSRKPVVRWALELPDHDHLDLVGDDIVIGRKPRSDDGAGLLMIPDPTRTLSKSHARLRLNDDEWTIEDLDSTNGLELISDDGVPELIDPGTPRVATERMIIGTLEVRLVRVD